MGVSAIAQGDRPGHIKAAAFGTVSPGYLACDGSAVSRATYAALFAAIGTNWGAGDGSTTFNLPDLRGRAMIGSGTGSGLTARTLAQSGGAETHTLAASEMPSHSHNVQGANDTTGGASPLVSISSNVSGVEKATTSAGSGSAHNNMQPFKVVMFEIKY